LASYGGAAHADNINTSGTVCRNFLASEALDIGYMQQAVFNVSGAPRKIICAVPRSRLLATAPAVFFIDGHNLAGTGSVTHCVLAVHDEAGVLVASRNIDSPVLALAAAWEQAAVFAPGLVTTWDYSSLLCTLPAGGAGRILGISSAN